MRREDVVTCVSCTSWDGSTLWAPPLGGGNVDDGAPSPDRVRRSLSAAGCRSSASADGALGAGQRLRAWSHKPTRPRRGCSRAAIGPVRAHRLQAVLADQAAQAHRRQIRGIEQQLRELPARPESPPAQLRQQREKLEPVTSRAARGLARSGHRSACVDSHRPSAYQRDGTVSGVRQNFSATMKCGLECGTFAGSHPLGCALLLPTSMVPPAPAAPLHLGEVHARRATPRVGCSGSAYWPCFRRFSRNSAWIAVPSSRRPVCRRAP